MNLLHKVRNISHKTKNHLLSGEFRFGDFLKKFFFFLRFLLVLLVFSFPIACPAYSWLILDFTAVLNSYGITVVTPRMIWITAISDPFLWVTFFLSNHATLVFNYFITFFLSPIEHNVYLEDLRAIYFKSDVYSVMLQLDAWDYGPYYRTTFQKLTVWPLMLNNYFVKFLGGYYNFIFDILKAYVSNFDLNILRESLYSFYNGTTTLSFFTYFGVLFVLTVLLSFLLMPFLGLYGVFSLTSISLFFFWISSIFSTYFVWTKNITHSVDFGKWFYIHNDVAVHFEFYLDNLSMAFVLLVLTIAFFINIYTFAYFRYEPNVSRLILFIDVFVISMVILVLSGNLIMLYFGWEMIGITSFFLINFWSTRMGTVKAAFKAFVFNKVSDCFILFVIILAVHLNLDLNVIVFNEVVALHSQTTINTLQNNYSSTETIAFCFMIAAFIKSAQFGFHIWLPDSMEAPVPASALIHSATLVSAGVFLILRFYPLFELAPTIKNYILFFGSFTAFFGGLCSVFQTDVKRLLAYSTISHCGVLMFLTYFNNSDLVIIYLYVHGFFKAITFMCMGHVIRFANNYQDMRRMGGFYKYLPFEAMLCFISLLNLGGLFFSLGFYMKHFMLLDSSPESLFNLFCFVLTLIGSLAGIVYSYKLYYYIFFDFKKGRKNVYIRISNDSNKNLYFTNASLASNVSILFLTIFAYIFSGVLIYSYIEGNLAFFDWVFSLNVKNQLKSFNNPFLLNFFFYLNWIIFLVVVFLVINNWKNHISSFFKIKFFIFIFTFLFFFYFFYIILIN